MAAQKLPLMDHDICRIIFCATDRRHIDKKTISRFGEGIVKASGNIVYLNGLYKQLQENCPNSANKIKVKKTLWPHSIL